MNNDVCEIRGKVINKVVKTPIPFVRVSVKGTKFETTCNEIGEYVISQIPPGKYTVCASIHDYISDEIGDISISSGETQVVNFFLAPVGYFDLKQWTPYYTKIAMIIALAGFIIPCMVIPYREPKPYQRKTDIVVQSIELPHQLKQLEEPPPPPKPEMLPVPAESDAEVERSTIDPTTFTGFEKELPPPTTNEGDDIIWEYQVVEEPPELLRKYCLPPEYPELARKAGIHGQVILECIVDTMGLVIDVKVSSSLHEVMDEAAIKAVRKWRFKPARQRNKPVKVRVTVPVRFTLE